mgnify:FL=1
MRTRYTLINMVVNIGGQLFNQVLLFISRMVFIHYLSAAYLGVNGLFTDVLGILNLAELGIGTAMIYSLYEPAAKDDEHRLAQLMNLYKILYRVVAVIVLLVGLALMPFLGFFIKDSGGIENLRLIYLMYVANSACSYLLSYKNSIFLAYQKAYIRNLWVVVFDALRTIAQIIIIVLTQNFILYLLAQFVLQFIPNIIVSCKADKEYPYLKESKELPDKEEIGHIMRNVGAMSLHKLATVIVRNTDSLLMSSFVGLLSVGIYSNYKLVLSGINNLMDKFSNAFTGSLGNLGAIEDETRVYGIYQELDLLFFVIYAYWTAGLFALFNSFITICFGPDYCFSVATVAVLVMEFYISGQRKVNLMFREAKGLFWYDRYKPLFESVINLTTSLLLVQKFGVAGVLGGTVISSVCTCVWVEPYILMKYGIRENWQERLKDYFVKYIQRLGIVVGLTAVTCGWVHFFPAESVFSFLLDGVVYTAFYGGVMYALFHKSMEFQMLRGRVLGIVKRKKSA